MAAIGDIVTYQDRQMVVVELVGNAFGTKDAVLIGKWDEDDVFGVYHRRQAYADTLPIVSTPVFEDGEAVKVGDRKGTVVTDNGGTLVPVNLSAAKHQLGVTKNKTEALMPEEELPVEYNVPYGAIYIEVEAARADVPRGQLVLENKL